MMHKLLLAGFVGMIGVALAPSAFAQSCGSPAPAPTAVMIPQTGLPIPQGMPIHIHVEVPGAPGVQPTVPMPTYEAPPPVAMPQSMPGEDLLEAAENALLEHGAISPEQHAQLSQARAHAVRHVLHHIARLHHAQPPVVMPPAVPTAAPPVVPLPVSLPVSIPITIPAVIPAS